MLLPQIVISSHDCSILRENKFWSCLTYASWKEWCDHSLISWICSWLPPPLLPPHFLCPPSDKNIVVAMVAVVIKNKFME
jgi:hypothetical protein